MPSSHSMPPLNIVFGAHSDESRWRAIAEQLVPHGFIVERGGAARAFAPMQKSPDEFGDGKGFALFGRIEDADVAVGEYTYESSDHNGNSQWSTACRGVLLHPRIEGEAEFKDDFRATTLGKVLNALLWVPPFTIAKAVQYIADRKDPDREVGDARFDTLYRVSAPSDALARKAIPHGMQSLCVRTRFRGQVRIKPGCISWVALDQNGLGAGNPLMQVGWAPLWLNALREGR